MIRFERFCWRYAGAPGPALQTIDLQVRPGELVVITGPSGSGKSTLALAMCGLLIGRQAGQHSGRISVAGHDVATTPLHTLAEIIGLVQQNPQAQFATLTVTDELAFGLENRCWSPLQIRAAIADAAAQLGIGHLGTRRLDQLSGGEQQRVAIASLLAGTPRVLVLDEPTAGLDAQAAQSLFHTLAGLCARTGLTVVIIEHKLALLRPLRPRLIELEAGRVVSDQQSLEVPSGSPNAVGGDGDPADGPRPQALPGKPLIEVSNLTVERAGRRVLRDLDLVVRSGEVVALLGPNGGGKTTLLHTLMGLLPAAGGCIRLCGRKVTSGQVSRLADIVGLVFQNAEHQLVADTVWDEIRFASRVLRLAPQTVDAYARRLLVEVGLAGRECDHPYRLSWGQKRRLNLVSVLLHQPRVLLLDEPFAGQDRDHAGLLAGVLRRVTAGEEGRRGVCLLVTHDARVVRHVCTRVVFLVDGRIRVDAPVPLAFEQLRQMGLGAYTAT